MKQIRISILFLCCLLLIFYSCENETETLNNTDLIFHNSESLDINPYSYLDEDTNEFHIQGDTIYFTSIPDTLNNKPEFRWKSMDFGITTIALFTAPIRVSGSEIKNVNNVIWQWHTGMKFGIEGEVQFSEGKNVINGIIDYNNEPQHLNPGIYYWAVWRWDSDGIKILYSSRQMYFYVK